MFLIRSQPARPPALNAIAPISDQAQRRTTRLGRCDRLAELGMELAEAAQREALRELQPRPERRPVPPGQYMPPSQPPARDTTPAELFDSFSRCVRQAILLEARLDSGAFDRPPPARTPSNAAPNSGARSHASEPGDGTSLYHERLQDDLAADANRSPEEILVDIRDRLDEASDRMPPACPPAPPDRRPAVPPQHPERTRPGPTIRPEKRPPPKPG